MNMADAKEIAKKMTFRVAVNNALRGRCVPYKKATRIKLNELLEILDKGLTLTVTDFADKCMECGKHANRWISVNERLPEKAFDCFLTIDLFDINGKTHRAVYPYIVRYDGKTWSDTYEGDLVPYDVIAWMPLPQPYTRK